MKKGNRLINTLMVKTIFDSNILTPLPKVLVEEQYCSMFYSISPIHYDCGIKLNVNSHYTRFILMSYGTITCNTTYWICPNCKENLKKIRW